MEAADVLDEACEDEVSWVWVWRDPKGKGVKNQETSQCLEYKVISVEYLVFLLKEDCETRAITDNKKCASGS